MKTPEEIKKALECCSDADGFDGDCINCPYKGEQWCGDKSKIDALLYIQRLENQIGELAEKVELLDQVTRERDVLLDIAKKLRECAYCKHDSYCTHTIPDCMNCKDENCKCYSCEHQSKWQWRGVQEGER